MDIFEWNIINNLNDYENNQHSREKKDFKSVKKVFKHRAESNENSTKFVRSPIQIIETDLNGSSTNIKKSKNYTNNSNYNKNDDVTASNSNTR